MAEPRKVSFACKTSCAPGLANRVVRRLHRDYAPNAMWREFTKETPARSGLAVIATAAALGCTTALAYFVTTSKAAPAAQQERQSLAGWPIKFDLPVGFQRVANVDDWQEQVSADGTCGSLRYVRVDRRQGPAILEVHYRVEDGPLETDKVFRSMTGLSSEGAKEIPVGPLSGLVGHHEESDGSVVLSAVACLTEGLALHFEMQAANDGPRQEKEFERICSSAEFKEWAIRRPY